MASKITVNLELLLYLAFIMESLSSLARENAFDLVYTRCTEWWEESGKLHDCFTLFYNVISWEHE